MKWNEQEKRYYYTRQEWDAIHRAGAGLGNAIPDGGRVWALYKNALTGECYGPLFAGGRCSQDAIDYATDVKARYGITVEEEAPERLCKNCEYRPLPWNEEPCRACMASTGSGGTNRPNFTPKGCAAKGKGRAVYYAPRSCLLIDEEMRALGKCRIFIGCDSTLKACLPIFPWAVVAYPMSEPTALDHLGDALEVVRVAPPARIDKHAVADAIEIAVGKCLDGSYTGWITDCKVCQIMGYTQHTGARAECQRCPLGPSVLPDGSGHYGCYCAMRDIENKKPGAAARVYAIIDSLRRTTGDDRWIEIAGKKRTVRRTDVADAIERWARLRIAGSREKSPVCRLIHGVDDYVVGSPCERTDVCPLADLGCNRMRDVFEDVNHIITSLRSQGGEIEL